MKKSYPRIAEDHLKVGEVYRVRTSIGEVCGKLLSKSGPRFKITVGNLKSEARDRSWSRGDEFVAPPLSEFFEVPSA